MLDAIFDILSKDVIRMLKHLKSLPPDEIYNNIDVMILTLEGKKWDEIVKEVYRSNKKHAIFGIGK